MSDSRIKRVSFADAKLQRAFENLKSGKFEDKWLASEISSAIGKLGADPFCGVSVGKRLWPYEYVKSYGIDNLRKYNMRKGWRLIYTIAGNQVEIVSIMLEWLDHKSYEKRFGYKSR